MPVFELVCVPVPDPVRVPVPLTLGVFDPVSVVDEEVEGEEVVDAVREAVMVCDRVPVAVTDLEGELLGVCEGVVVPEPDTLEDPVLEPDPVSVPVMDAEVVREGVFVGDAVTEGVFVSVVVEVIVRDDVIVCVFVCVEEGVWVGV